MNDAAAICWAGGLFRPHQEPAGHIGNDPQPFAAGRQSARAIWGPGKFAKDFSLLKEGKAINYQGASGAVDFDQQGDVIAPIEIWKYVDGKIVTYSVEYQVPEE